MLKHKEKTKGLSIFHRLFFSILATSFLIIAILGTLYYFSARQRISEYVNAQIASSLSDAVTYFDNGYNTAISSDLVLLEAIPALNNFLSAPQYEKNLVRFDIEKLFFKLSQARGNLYQSIIFFNAYGEEKIAVVGKKRQRQFSSIAEYPQDSLRAQKIKSLFERLKAAEPGAILFEDLFTDAGGTQSFIVGISKREPEIAGFGGIILLTCDLGDFVDHVAKNKIFNTYGAWLFSSDGKTLLSPSSGGEGIKHFPLPKDNSPPTEGFGAKTADSYVQSICCTLGTDPQKIVEIAFRVTPDLYTGLLREALMKAFWLIVFITVVVFAVALILARQFSKPIKDLVEASQLLSKGDFQVQVDVDSKGEIGVLARSFNEMSETLHQSIVAMDNEIAYRKQSENSLIEKEEEIRLLLDSTVEAIYGIDQNGNCTFCNNSFLRLLDYEKKEDLLGHHMHSIMHHTKADGAEYPLAECSLCQCGQYNNACLHVDDEVFWRADGTSFWAEYRSHPVIKDGGVVGAVITFIDISDIKAAEDEKEKLNAQLKQAQKMEAIGTLAGGIAHDFNNILQAIIGYVEIAKSEIPVGSQIDDDLDEVLKAGNRAKELVKQILTFSRQTEYERKPLQIDLVVKEALKLLRASIPQSIEIQEDIDPNCGTILADQTQIHQVVMNLCTNAYHAMRVTGGGLSIKLAKIEIEKNDKKVSALHLSPGPYIVLKISDTGHGMNRATMDRIFEPYFTTKEKGDGTGMGLALIHGIIKSCGGHITVHSEFGKGTSFHVYLPRIVTSTTDPVGEIGENIPTGNERVLVVDDEELVVALEKRVLERLGYTVMATSSSEEALLSFSSQPDNFDLVITDMTMPHMNGAELAQKILAIRADIPIIMCSGFSELMTEDKAKAIGIREYIMKPVVSNEMARVVRRALDLARH